MGVRVGERLRGRREAVEGRGRERRCWECFVCAGLCGGSPAVTNRGGGREEEETAAGRVC
jgi:hypothetical protein